MLLVRETRAQHQRANKPFTALSFISRTLPEGPPGSLFCSINSTHSGAITHLESIVHFGSNVHFNHRAANDNGRAMFTLLPLARSSRMALEIAWPQLLAAEQAVLAGLIRVSLESSHRLAAAARWALSEDLVAGARRRFERRLWSSSLLLLLLFFGFARTRLQFDEFCR